MSALAIDEETWAALRQTTGLAPDEDVGHRLTGLAALHTKKLRTAAAAFREALRLNPQSAEAMNDLGVVQSRRGNYPSATTSFMSALRTAPTDPHYIDNLRRMVRMWVGLIAFVGTLGCDLMILFTEADVVHEPGRPTRHLAVTGRPVALFIVAAVVLGNVGYGFLGGSAKRRKYVAPGHPREQSSRCDSRPCRTRLDRRDHLAPRSAAVEHRLSACVSDCGPYDLFDTSASRLPAPLARQLPDGNPTILRLLARILGVVMKKPTAGWALRRNLLVHGLTQPLEFFRMVPSYTLKGMEQQITCPTLVCAAKGDDLTSRAKVLFDRLSCEKTYVQFRTIDGAGRRTLRERRRPNLLSPDRLRLAGRASMDLPNGY